ncbi:hypothetical protein K378_03794 [Streptomyces sp. Amel2xB2]|uniref:hypothetical protein n=1 Tax=Streptomyces sp. Amel2xB2 TaxID=1305829 RepID=UPI000DB98796|nr:hypothetical protein [Streptomyces sp. Amel2xB2]RAJ62443.1 hypothetical protein K378_03794 [Streptomyces sp. Amel2xB2]
MTADEARRVERVMRSLGISGVVAPADPEDPSGEWSVFDEADPGTRRDKTAEVLAAIAEHVPEQDTGSPRRGPMRGFAGLPPRDR